jgi:hypothetical protein
MDHPPTLAHPHALPFAERTTECFFPWVTSASPAGKKSNMPNGWALNVATLKPLSKDSHSFYAPPKGRLIDILSPKTNLVKAQPSSIDFVISDLVALPVPTVEAQLE